MTCLAVPLAFVVVTWWAADQVRVSRSLRQGDLVALMSQPTVPALNPFMPETEAGRQLVHLVHAPLIKVNDQGRIAPALASNWRWLKRVTVWFAEPSAAAQAKVRLDDARIDHWLEWKLESVALSDRALTLIYTDPMMGNVSAALQTARARVQGVNILRVELKGRAKAARVALMLHPQLAKFVRGQWSDDEDAFEIAIAGLPRDFDFLREMQLHLEKSLPDAHGLKTTLQFEGPTLEEPVLEFTLRDAMWHDGAKVTANDVKATFDAVRAMAWPLPNREGLRVVRDVEVIAPNRLQVVLWRHYGPAICAWMGLPILPAAWLEGHRLDAEGRVFRTSIPPGAGPCRVEYRNHSSMVIAPVQATSSSVRRLTLITSLSPFTVQLGYNTNALDLFWPSAPSLPQPTLRSEALVRRSASPQHAYQLIWNTRRDPVSTPAVREALATATSRGELIEKALHGHGREQTSLFATGLWLSTQPPSTKADLTRAESLLAQAGWLRNVQGAASNGHGLMMFTLAAPTEEPTSQRIAAELRLQWTKIGVQVVVKLQPRATIERAMKEHAFDGVVRETPPLTSWDLWDAWHTDEPGNVTGVSDRQLDLLLEALRREFLPDEAAPRVQRAESIILGTHAVLPLVTEHEETVMRESLTNTAAASKPWSLGDLLLAPSSSSSVISH